MEFGGINNVDIKVSRICLGTWSIGGWLWGGSDESTSIKTIHSAIDKGINFIDTAAVYGFGASEKIVGKAIKNYVDRKNIVIATKCGLEWNEKGIFRNSTEARLAKEIDDSLKRLQTDYIDIYQIHWPDPKEPIEETARVMEKFKKEGRIRAVGVSNYSVEQMKRFNSITPLSTSQPPYNLLERGIEDDVLPFCKSNNISLLLYGVLCRGLLSGKINRHTVFKGDDIRKKDPKFSGKRFDQYLDVVNKLDEFAKDNFNADVLQLSVRWVLDRTVDEFALWGARKPEQLDKLESIFKWRLDDEAIRKIENIVDTIVTDPIGPEFMAPPARN